MPDMNEEFANGDIRDPITAAIETVDRDRTAQIHGGRGGRPSLFTCPECGGTLWQVDEPELIQFRCHTGHILTGEALLAGQTTAAENSLWYTIRTQIDRGVLARELAQFARSKGEPETAAEFEARARDAEQQAEALQRIVERRG